MKHWILGLVFMMIAILCGYELGIELMKEDKNWFKIPFFAIICVAALIFYLKERKKRNAYFRDRMKK